MANLFMPLTNPPVSALARFASFRGSRWTPTFAIVGLTIASPDAFLEPCRVCRVLATTAAVRAVGAYLLVVLPSDLAAEGLSERVPVFAVYQNVAKALGFGESLAPLLSANTLQLLDTHVDPVHLRPAIVRKEAPSQPIRDGDITRTLVGHHILPGRFAQQHDHEQKGK
jgi:hypothetical protein